MHLVKKAPIALLTFFSYKAMPPIYALYISRMGRGQNVPTKSAVLCDSRRLPYSKLNMY